MAVLTTVVVQLAGTAPALVAANAGGDRCEVGDTVFLHAKTTGTVSTITIDSVTPSNYGDDVNLVIAMPATGERLIGPLKASRFASAADGLAAITYSSVTGLTVEAVRI